jgi:hypothetical protein
VVKPDLGLLRFWAQIIELRFSLAQAFTPGAAESRNHDFFFPQLPFTGPYGIVGEHQPEAGNPAA